MNHLTASRERKPQPAQSHDRCDRARGMCGARRAMCGALAPNVRSSGLQCAELTTPMCGARPPGIAALTEEIRSFRNSEFPPYSNTKNILLRMDPPVLSCPVLSCGHARFGQMSESMRTKSGQKADANRTGALRTRLGGKRLDSGHHRHRAGHLSRASACGHRWTSVRIKADRMRTECGRKADRCPHRSGQNADRMRTKSGRGLSRSRWTAGRARACTRR